MDIFLENGRTWRTFALGTIVFMRKQFIRGTVEMLFLSIMDSLLRGCYLRWRHQCQSNEGRGYYGMDCTDEHAKNM
jgi:hypothetical protein